MRNGVPGYGLRGSSEGRVADLGVFNEYNTGLTGDDGDAVDIAVMIATVAVAGFDGEPRKILLFGVSSSFLLLLLLYFTSRG